MSHGTDSDIDNRNRYSWHTWFSRSRVRSAYRSADEECLHIVRWNNGKNPSGGMIAMSLKFGIYLVEQRIVTPEQFCGLVKIQQESTRSIASLAIKHNILTIKQVSRLQDLARIRGVQLIEIATEDKLVDRADADRLTRLQEQSGESIRSLAVECGLLTDRQAEVLFNHFLRHGSRAISLSHRQPIQKAQGVIRPKQKMDAAQSKPPTPSPKFRKSPIISQCCQTASPQRLGQTEIR